MKNTVKLGIGILALAAALLSGCTSKADQDGLKEAEELADLQYKVAMDNVKYDLQQAQLENVKLKQGSQAATLLSQCYTAGYPESTKSLTETQIDNCGIITSLMNGGK